MSALTAGAHTAILTGRALRGFFRFPMYLAMNLIQPVIWLLLFGQLFKSVVSIPGFTGGGNYLVFLTPGIVMMMALFGSAWAGTSYIQDMDSGVMDRFLASPTNRGAMIVATMLYQAVLTVIQTVVVLGVAWLAGARFDGGWLGLVVLLLAAVLLTSVFSAFSNAVALLTGDHTALIGISQLISFPLMFLSSAIMDTGLSPAWVRQVARFNPFEWAVVAGRGALQTVPDWGVVWANLGLLAGLAVVMSWLAARAFGGYQRSL
ncbi:multidrug ABC transporter permease [Arthrobacter sp. ERGS1:01]|uniref:ABC transporter permease n=1 Tax=Arthrobacter sp. ERGS1:01 TaxID=1704044 RepID=UPI0006B67DA1|nr:ABC transporter permease [Arthrobacter sp. ERGS1:01]ALE05903.1 multidrug ABC transporter permease [Arthrobacter sp. ERGS1:01]